MRRRGVLVSGTFMVALTLVVACTSSGGDDSASCAELTACCDSVTATSVQQMCNQITQTGNEQACAQLLAKFMDGGTC